MDATNGGVKSEDTQDVGVETSGPLEWRSQPWRQVTGSALVVFLLFVALLLYAAIWMSDAIMVGLTTIAMLYVLGPLLVPTRYRLDDQGVSRISPLARRRYEWSEFSGYRVDPRGRSVFLRFGGRGMGRFRPAVVLFVPDATVLSAVESRVKIRLRPIEKKA